MNARDELAWTLRQKFSGWMGPAVSYDVADEVIAAGYWKVDHAEYALNHRLSDLQFTDDDGELWTDEEYVKDYADEYGDSAALVQRHVTEWEPVK